MQIYDAVISLVGAAPSGFDILVWIFSALLLFFLLRSVFSILHSVISWIGGK